MTAPTTSARLPREGAALRRLALSYPEALEEMPWGHHAIKVGGKAFVPGRQRGHLFPFRGSYRAIAPRRLVALLPAP